MVAMTREMTRNVSALAMLSVGLALAAASARAQDGKSGKGIRFWNLTLHTITSLRMSPPGENKWGPDQCRNDRDGTVDHDERLRITGIAPGRYDVQLADATGRICIVSTVEVQAGAIFTIEERQLTNCRR
jgi:hypothetical protein